MEYKILRIDVFNESHISSALNLLSQTFASNDFSVEWWNWKYQRNPFGEPFGFAAQIPGEDSFIGMRMAWPWRFSNGEQEILMYQSLDTATDIQYRGKGIFKNLTLQIIQEAEKRNTLIYNFPNDNSYIPYKKLGWKDIDKINWHVMPIFSENLYNLPYRLCFKSLGPDLDTERIELANLQFFDSARKNKIFKTFWTKELIRWRFVENPKNDYFLYNHDGTFIIYSFRYKLGIRLCQVVLTENINSISLKNFKQYLGKFKTDGIVYNAINSHFGDLMRKHKFSFQLKSSINYVYKPINNNIIPKLKLELAEMDYF